MRNRCTGMRSGGRGLSAICSCRVKLRVRRATSAGTPKSGARAAASASPAARAAAPCPRGYGGAPRRSHEWKEAVSRARATPRTAPRAAAPRATGKRVHGVRARGGKGGKRSLPLRGARARPPAPAGDSPKSGRAATAGLRARRRRAHGRTIPRRRAPGREHAARRGSQAWRWGRELGIPRGLESEGATSSSNTRP